MMAAEIMTASRMGPSGSSDNFRFFQNMYGSFIELDRTVRRDASGLNRYRPVLPPWSCSVGDMTVPIR